MIFTKAQTNGNDFIILENVNLTPEEIKKIADRRFGIGCDQVIIIKNDFELTFFNSDGSKADMCGNGTAAASLYIYQKRHIKDITLKVQDREYKAYIENETVKIMFPIPHRVSENIIDTGNLHMILPMSQIENYRNPDYNLHFIEQISNGEIKVKTFEKGTGWTLACGSGAIAICFYSGKSLKILHDGGQSKTEITDKNINLIVKPKMVYVGQYNL